MSDEPADSQTVAEYTRLISLAVHELRTPLSVIGGYLRMLRDDAGGVARERQRRMIDEAEKSCQRLSTLVEELSELGKLDAGTAAVAVETFDIFTLVHDVAAMLSDEPDAEARLVVDGPTSGGHLTGDKARLRAALTCAMRAVRREHRGTTTVVVDVGRAFSDGRRVALIVVAPSSDLQRAKQAPAGPLHDARGGIGLGLPIARRVVARFGGQIWSPVPPADESQAHSGGALAISLPLSD